MNSRIGKIANVSLAISWFYQGLMPKIIFKHPQEIAMVTNSGVFSEEQAVTIVMVAGILECIFASAFLLFPHSKIVHWLNISALTVLCAGALFTEISLFIFPFNPATLSITMIALSLISLECNTTEQN